MKTFGIGLMAAAVLVATTPAADAAVFFNSDGQRVSDEVITKLDEMIDQALQRLMAGSDRLTAQLDAIMDDLNERSNNLSNARFRESAISSYTGPVKDGYITVSTYSDGSQYSRVASSLEIQNYQQAAGLNEAVTAVPEPVTWAMMLAGFGMVASAARRRRARQASHA